MPNTVSQKNQQKIQEAVEELFEELNVSRLRLNELIPAVDYKTDFAPPTVKRHLNALIASGRFELVTKLGGVDAGTLYLVDPQGPAET